MGPLLIMYKKIIIIMDKGRPLPGPVSSFLKWLWVFWVDPLGVTHKLTLGPVVRKANSANSGLVSIVFLRFIPGISLIAFQTTRP